MTRNNPRKTLERLEAMAVSGGYDKAKDAIRRGSPVLAELGLTEDQAIEALEMPPGKLESIGVPPGQLEAIVKATGRPPLIVQDGRVMGVGSLGKDFPPDIDSKIAAVEHLLGSIGRVEFLNHDLVWGGTGWVIRDDGPAGLLIATNRHVAQIVARRTHRGDGVFLFGAGNNPYGAALDTGEELGGEQNPARLLVIDKFVYLAEDAAADVALARVRLQPSADGFERLELADRDGEDDELVAVVGYPASDPLRNDPGTMQSYFKGVYEVKRFSPGFLRASAGPSQLSHDCTTLGGNSGSPVISLISGKVVGLHFAGEFGVGNAAVRSSTLHGLLDRVSTTGGIVVPPLPPEAASGAAGRFDGRLGYDPDFLRTEQVPLPQVADHWGLARPEGAPAANPHELRYQHFSVLYSGTLKTPVIAALNLDGGQMRAVKSRANWRKDPRLSADLQLGAADYDAAAIDRGHLVRREATNWGTQAQAEQADDDSFHYTVCSPQHVAFNRNPGIWLQIEDHVLRHSRTHGFRVNVMVGPILNGTEPTLGTSGASLPLAYFKVLSMLAEDATGALRLHATGYVLSQGQLIQKWLADMGRTEGTEGFAFGAFKTFQVRIADIEAETGHDFGPLRAADPLAAAVAAEGPRGRPFRSLERAEDLLL